jgi:hypothetical protein
MKHDERRRDDDAGRTEETVGPDGTHSLTTYDHEGRVRSTVTWPINRVVHVYEIDRASSHDIGVLDDDNLQSNGSR